MADSLLQLKQEMEAAKGASKPQPQAVPIPTDSLIKEAVDKSVFDNEDEDYINRFRLSKELVDAKIAESPEFEQTVVAKLSGLKGAKLANGLIDAADEIKINHLKETDPLFNQGAALTAGFLDEAAFGQLSKIAGKAGELIQGRPYEEVVKEQAERFRLLQKAYPKSDIAARAASYLVPGSPAKALFTAGARLGEKAAGKLISKMVTNPKLIEQAIKGPNLVERAVRGGMAVGFGAAATETVKRAAGQNLEDFDLERGLEDGASTGMTAALVGFGAPVVGRAIGKTAELAAPIVNSGAKAAQRLVGETVGTLSGTPADVLRAASKNPQGLRKAFGTQADIGDDLTDFLLSAKRSKLPEVQQAEKLLPQLPEVDATPVLKFLKGFKRGLDPSKDSQVELLNQWGTRIQNQLKGENVKKLPAEVMREIVDDLQNAASEEFGKQSGFLGNQLKTASRLARTSISDTAAKEGGDTGRLYNELMKKGSEKREILKFFGKSLGTNPDTMLVRSEAFVDRIFGKNKSVAQSRMQQLDSMFGTNFYERSQLAAQAKQLGNQGKPALFSNLTTGKSGLGTSTGATLGGALGGLVLGPAGVVPGAAFGGAIGNIASSPRAGAALIGATDRIAGITRKLFADPAAINRIAKGGGYPIEVRRIAQEIEKGLRLDGPIGASGVVRLAADTPYFLGLAHAFEIESRKRNENVAGRALERIAPRPSPQDIATPQPGY